LIGLLEQLSGNQPVVTDIMTMGNM